MVMAFVTVTTFRFIQPFLILYISRIVFPNFLAVHLEYDGNLSKINF